MSSPTPLLGDDLPKGTCQEGARSHVHPRPRIPTRCLGGGPASDHTRWRDRPAGVAGLVVQDVEGSDEGLNRVEKFLLARDGAVQRRRLDPALLAEPAQGGLAQVVGLRQLERRTDAPSHVTLSAAGHLGSGRS
jgi:hypothetical protein